MLCSSFAGSTEGSLPCGKSVVASVSKKQFRRVCDVNTFRGISLTFLVSKVVCKILENRLSSAAEDKGLIMEEQGGFCKKRGCWDQLLPLPVCW